VVVTGGSITPAAGYVSFDTAPVIGLLAGVVCYYAVAIKKVTGWDDAPDVWGVYMVSAGLWAPSCSEYLLRKTGIYTVRQVYCRAALGSFFGSALPSLHQRPGRLPSAMRHYG